MSTFKPTRAELRRIQYLAHECETDARATQQQPGRRWYGMHRPAQRSAEAFALSARVAARAGA
ncbi:hypothetical protein [Thermomonas sp.]|uniref:hypothetical protein n=1 Tax=Thermomonas sp. TaxID=1971895 RepID=UPI0035AF4E0E